MRIQKTHRLRWLLLLLLIMMAYAASYAQYENVWAFGSMGAGLDFNSGSPVYIPTAIMKSREGCASVCDGSGQMQFYTDGTNVWNRNNNLMPNGNELLQPNGGITDYTWSTSQGAVIVPIPYHPGQYYVFSLTICREGSDFDPDTDGLLFYSMVDMSLNDGLGDVMPYQKGIFLDSLGTEKMTAVLGDDCNVWLLAFSEDPMGIKAYEITAEGLNTTPVFSPIELCNFCNTYKIYGHLVASPNGHKLALAESSGNFDLSYGLQLFDFNPSIGIVSNPVSLGIYGYKGVAFSPDNTKVYTFLKLGSTNDWLLQFDLNAANPAASVAVLDDTINASTSDLKLGPDGKIYFITQAPWAGSQLTVLQCIEQPNLSGVACSINSNVLTIPNPDGSDAHSEGYGFAIGLPNSIAAVPYDSLLTVHDVGPVCFNDTFRLTAQETNGWDYVWNTGDTDTALTVTSSGDYYVTYFTSCRLHADTFHVTILGGQLPELHAQAGCRGDSNALVWATPAPGDAAAYSYTWYHNGQQVQGPTLSAVGDTLANAQSGTTYHLLFQAPTGCAQGLDIEVPVPDYEAAFQVDTIVCEGEAVQFSNASTSDISGYSWDFGDGAVSDQAGPQHTYTGPGTYTVQMIGNTGYPCYDTARQTITVDPILEGGFSVSRDSICTGESITITPWADSGALSLGWTSGDGSAFTRYDVQPFKHAFDVAGDLPVSLALGSRACPDVIITDTVHVYPLPVVNLGPDTSLCLNGAPVYLQNQYTADENIRGVVWSTRDTTAELKVVHPGVYSLTVRAEPIGCSNTDAVEVKKDCYIDIPNVFSPNGDGVNDYFFPRQLLSKKLTAFRMQVLNRWGQVVFEATSIEGRGWDGRFNNVDQPAGAYVYVIDVTIDEDRKEHYEGNVTLLR